MNNKVIRRKTKDFEFFLQCCFHGIQGFALLYFVSKVTFFICVTRCLIDFFPVIWLLIAS